MLKPKPSVLAAPRYQPASRNVPDPSTAIYVDANESALGPSPAARAAGIAAAANPERYPDGLSTALRRKIAGKIGVDPAFIVCGHGSEELIHLCCRSLLEPGDEIVCGATAFAIYRIATMAAGGKVVDAEEVDYVLDSKSVAAKLTDRTRIVFVANPNNPTGALIEPEALDAIRRAIPPEVLLVLDTAYAEYVTAPGYSAGHEWVSEDGNVAVMRTFSKAYGLAAMRVGWLHGPAALVDALDRVRPVFNIPTPSQAAAEAAFGDEGHLEAVRQHAERSKAMYRAAADRLPPMLLGYTNFVFFPHAPGLTDHLSENNIVAFGLKGYRMPDAARVSFGTDEENARVIDAIAGWPGPNA
ncbi:MAG TPA: histidinol-phosphate transaminase [Caulobacteraceae bacterium]|jgi:histidinol-phosphate aminotransferase|nr:histidinol-phosphate transaminase [Caulobacteraceae bacterium]